MKNYKITLTTTEREKLNIFLVMYEDKLLENSRAFQELAEDKEFESKKDTFKSNAKWYKETYDVIHKIREDLDTMPF